MTSINKSLLLGRLGKDPEMRFTQSGMAQCTMALATSRTWKDDNGQKQEQTEWHRLIAYGKTAEFCGKWFHKGKLIWAEGRIQSRKYQDKQGVDRTVYEIIVSQVNFVGDKERSGADTFGGATPPPGAQANPSSYVEPQAQSGHTQAQNMGYDVSPTEEDDTPF